MGSNSTVYLAAFKTSSGSGSGGVDTNGVDVAIKVCDLSVEDCDANEQILAELRYIY